MSLEIELIPEAGRTQYHHCRFNMYYIMMERRTIVSSKSNQMMNILFPVASNKPREAGLHEFGRSRDTWIYTEVD